jgi:Tol biopolymer transport system component
MNMGGTNLKQIITSGFEPSWSPDGQKIIYIGFTDKKYDPQNNGTLWVMKADGSSRRQLTYGPN